jgi:hypothetical protein
MTIKLIIKGTPVELPESGQSPNWAPGILDAIKELAEVLNSIAGTYDVAPQVQDISEFEQNDRIDVNNLIFPFEEVRSATIFYSVFRKTESTESEEGVELTEAGTLQIVYNESNADNAKWEIQREFVGNAEINFVIADSGQIKFSTRKISGNSHIGKLAYRAIAILNT